MLGVQGQAQKLTPLMLFRVGNWALLTPTVEMGPVPAVWTWWGDALGAHKHHPVS